MIAALNRIEEKLDQILGKVTQIMTEQGDFNADISALTDDLNAVVPFLAGLPAQLTAIQGALAQQGITNLAPLDNLVTQAQGITGSVSSLGATLDTLPGGSAATDPTTAPVTPPATDPTDPSAPPAAPAT